MSSSKEISSSILFLFLINLIVGTGVFLNAGILSQLLGRYSFLSYFITGLLVFPILLITYNLSIMHENKNMLEIFQLYFKEKSFFIVSLYAFCKLATAAVAIVFSANLLKTFSELVSVFLPFWFFSLMIFLVCFLLSYLEYSISPALQFIIIFLKLIPILTIIFFACFFFFNTSYMSLNYEIQFSFVNLCEGGAITIFSFAGFEALFSMGNYKLIGNKKIQFSHLLIIGFLFSWLLYIFYQWGIVYLSSVFSGYIPLGIFDIFQIFGSSIKDNVCMYVLNKCMILCIFASSFGVAHGIIYASLTNLAYSFQICKKRRLMQYIVFFLLFSYVYIFYNKVFLLQQLSSLATILTYFLFVYIFYKKNKSILSYIGFFSFGCLMITHFYTAYFYLGFYGYILYFLLAVLLMLFFLFNRKLCAH